MDYNKYNMKKKTDKSCVECKHINIKTKLDSLRKIYLCESCSDSDKYKLIYKTHVKRDYFIDPDDLDHCDTYNRNIRGIPTTLFRLCDIFDYFCEQYDVDRNDKTAISAKQKELSETKKQQINERRMKIALKKNRIIESRKNKLVAALKECKLELRTDSKLCKGYINGTITDWTVPQIVYRMCKMKYLYDYCNMDYYLEKAHANQQEEYNAGYFPDCSVFDEAEYTALKKYGGYPDEWPWLKIEN